MRPFVLRPTGWAALPAAFVAAASFFFWAPLSMALGQWALVVPAICALIPLLVLIERIARYRKTEYVVRPDRLVVRTGSIFTKRTIELDLENVTLVEWHSPYLLRLFYGIGHVTAQEAGSATQNAKLAYVEEPEALYNRIAEYMRERGFSMQRAQTVRQERPGPVGALLDLLGRLAAFIYAIGVFGATEGADLWLLLADDRGPSVLQLLAGNYEVFSEMSFAVEMLARMRIGFFVLGGLGLLATGAYLTLTYIDLLRRTYTLHDDVIDYKDGFLSKTLRFIPLENLADTKLSRPIHKRLLGFGDLKVSSRGAGSEIVFQSLPRGKEFAAALERLLEQTDGPQAGPVEGTGGTQLEYVVDEPSAHTSTVPNTTFKPKTIRAVASTLLGLAPLTFFVMLGPFIAVMSGDTFELGPFAIASIGALALAALAVVGAFGIFGVASSIIKTMATEYSFDERRVSETFDFLSSRQTRFSVDKVTSISVLRNPLDRLMGTMTVRIRSIGTAETIDLQYIDHNLMLLSQLRQALGLQATGDVTSQLARLNPNYTMLEELKRQAAVFVAVPIIWVMALLVIVLVDEPASSQMAPWVLSAAFGIPFAVSAPYLLWRGVYYRRLQGSIQDGHVDVRGGVFFHFQHLSALRHVKAVHSLQYPFSSQGDLNLATGGGYSISIAHLPDLAARHRQIDQRLGEHPPRGHAKPTSDEGRPRQAVSYSPHVGTELLRHLRLVFTLFTLPVSGPWIWLVCRRTDYLIEGERISAATGILMRHRSSVRFDRIDHLETGRNFAHGPFGTADVEVYTVGSMACDLTLRSIAQHDVAMEHIRRRAETG